jgi:hypothetical protein
MNDRRIFPWVLITRRTWGMWRLLLKRRLVAHHKPSKASRNLSLTWRTSSNITQTPMGQQEKKKPCYSFVISQAIQSRGKRKAYLTSSWMAQEILWNKQRHTKQNSNSPKIELNWAWSQPQEVRGIKPRRTTRGEDTYKNKTTWLAQKMKLAWMWTLLTCLKRSPKM